MACPRITSKRSLQMFVMRAIDGVLPGECISQNPMGKSAPWVCQRGPINYSKKLCGRSWKHTTRISFLTIPMAFAQNMDVTQPYENYMVNGQVLTDSSR